MDEPNPDTSEVDDELTVAGLARRGKAPAEIAVRLDLSIGEVVDRIAALPPRDHPVDSAATSPAGHATRTRRFGWRSLVVALIAIAGGAVLLVSARLPRSNSSVPSNTEALLLGRLVRAAQGSSPAILSVSVRAALTVIQVAPGSLLTAPQLPAWSIEAAGNGQHVEFLGRVGERWILLTLSPAPGTAVRPLGGQNFAIHGSPATLFAVATNVQTGEALTLHVAQTTGEFSVGPSVGAGTVIDAPTGERLDVSHAVAAGTFSGAAAQFTSCDSRAAATGATCSVIWVGSNAMPAPANGLACFAGPGVEVFRMAAATLVIKDSGRPTVPPPCSAGTEQPIRKGEPLAGRGSYFIYGWGGGSRLQSAAIARDGSLFVGDIRPSGTCPCQSTADPFPFGGATTAANR